MKNHKGCQKEVLQGNNIKMWGNLKGEVNFNQQVKFNGFKSDIGEYDPKDWLYIELKKSIMDYTVPYIFKSIEDNSFREFPNLERIIIPNSIQSIGNEAFKDCKKLKHVIISDSVKDIGEDIFYNSSNIYIHGYNSSMAETYAKTNKIRFVEMYDLRKVLFSLSISNEKIDEINFLISNTFAHKITNVSISNVNKKELLIETTSDNYFKNLDELI